MLCIPAAFGTVTYFGDAAQPGLLQIVSDLVAHPANLTAYQHMALDWIPFCLMLGSLR